MKRRNNFYKIKKIATNYRMQSIYAGVALAIFCIIAGLSWIDSDMQSMCHKQQETSFENCVKFYRGS